MARLQQSGGCRAACSLHSQTQCKAHSAVQPPFRPTRQRWSACRKPNLHKAVSRAGCTSGETEDELLDSLPLAQFALSEASLILEGIPGRRHSRGLLLRPAEPVPLGTLGSAEETESLLHGGTRLGGTAGSGGREVLLAGDDSAQHATWLKWLSKVCSSKGLAEDSSESKQARAYSTGIRSPPESVVRRLCGPGLVRGRQLMERLKQTRWQLEAGVRDLSSVREEARNAQRPLNDLHGILLDMSQALDVHHDDVTQEEDLSALRQCQDWLQGAITFVMEVDHQIEQLIYSEPGLNVAAEWVQLCTNTVLQLHDIEIVMRAEELRQLQQQRLRSQGAGSCCRSLVTAPAMPYGRWWAKKTAL